jgi:acyl-CoA synthetase (AMP-forming)/AMP-acid ligase II
MVGYFGEREAGGTLDDGWLDTGDLGFVADGELYVCGREKDVIIIRGANHAPQEFEDCLDGLDGIRSGRVVALGFVPEGQDGEQLLLLAERSIGLRQPGSDEALAALVRRVVLERTGIRPYAVQIVEPGTLPRTSSGKLRRNEALRRFLEGN